MKTFFTGLGALFSRAIASVTPRRPSADFLQPSKGCVEWGGPKVDIYWKGYGPWRSYDHLDREDGRQQPGDIPQDVMTGSEEAERLLKARGISARTAIFTETEEDLDLPDLIRFGLVVYTHEEPV